MNRKINVEKIIGYILLAPAIISVFLFLYQLVGLKTDYNHYNDTLFNFVSSCWTGKLYSSDAGGSGGYTSALPFYFGLMAIAGAYLIKNNKNSNP